MQRSVFYQALIMPATQGYSRGPPLKPGWSRVRLKWPVRQLRPHCVKRSGCGECLIAVIGVWAVKFDRLFNLACRGKNDAILTQRFQKFDSVASSSPIPSTIHHAAHPTPSILNSRRRKRPNRFQQRQTAAKNRASLKIRKISDIFFQLNGTGVIFSNLPELPDVATLPEVPALVRRCLNHTGTNRLRYARFRRENSKGQERLRRYQSQVEHRVPGEVQPGTLFADPYARFGMYGSELTSNPTAI